jgi:hypothetical protein
MAHAGGGGHPPVYVVPQEDGFGFDLGFVTPAPADGRMQVGMPIEVMGSTAHVVRLTDLGQLDGHPEKHVYDMIVTFDRRPNG